MEIIIMKKIFFSVLFLGSILTCFPAEAWFNTSVGKDYTTQHPEAMEVEMLEESPESIKDQITLYEQTLGAQAQEEQDALTQMQIQRTLEHRAQAQKRRLVKQKRERELQEKRAEQDAINLINELYQGTENIESEIRERKKREEEIERKQLENQKRRCDRFAELKKLHAENTDDIELIIEELINENKISEGHWFSCPVCGYLFSKIHGYKKHLKSVVQKEGKQCREQLIEKYLLPPK